MATITITLNDQKDSKGVHINKQVIKCSPAVLFEDDRMKRRKSPDDLNKLARSIAHDINPHYHSAQFDMN